jgi:SP family general alpha glucoside:H+ symporter-like MFS transporter
MLYLLGLGLCGISFLFMGCISLAPEGNQGVKWGIAVLLFISVFFYDMTIGPKLCSH